MTDIAEVIGWKFNHQPGMSTRDGVITEFPGGIPSAQDQATWTAEYDAEFSPTKETARAEITRLESTVTPRRLREALAGQPGKDWIAGTESAIAIERAKLNG